MKEITKKWFNYANADIDVAKIALTSPKSTKWTYLLIIWHCHQAIEKALKAIMIEKDFEIIKIHDLQRLMELSKIDFKDSDISFIGKLNKYYIRPRYPDLGGTSLPKANKEIVKYYFDNSAALFNFIKHEIS